MKKHLLFGFVVLMNLLSCDIINPDDVSNSKTSDSDPFKESIVESQFFKISTENDTILEGEQGTILQIPKNAFIDENGNPVHGEISIELAEPESLEDYLLSGINTIVNGRPFISQGSFFLKATHNGKTVRIDSENPIYVEKIKESERRGEVKILHGEKDENGQINWEEKKEAENFLIAVDIESLDFLPVGFREEVVKGMPFRSHEIATESLIDSLYSSLFHNGQNIENTFTANVIESNTEENVEFLGDTASGVECGIDPAIIETISNEEFEGTIIATREFEKRLKAIFKSCNNDLIQLYIDNMDRNLWEIDSLAAEKLGSEHESYAEFNDFSKEKLTRVKNGKNAQKLSTYYKKQLEKVKARLNELRLEALEEAKKKNEIAAAKRKEYDELLQKREKYRMEKFGFELKEFGWYNGAIYVEDLEKFVLEITVQAGDEFDRVHTYIVNNRIRSIFAMISDDQILFNRGHNLDNHLLMWKNQNADAIVIAYKNDQAYFEKKTFKVSTEEPILLKFKPKAVSDFNLKWKLKGDLLRNQENRITKDLKYQAFFEKERKRLERLRRENAFINRLRAKAFACCYEEPEGKILFKKHCSSCHYAGKQALIGPGLAGLTKRYSMEWLVRFTQNSTEMIEKGDPHAVETFLKHKKSVMPSFSLTSEEIEAIFEYADNLNE